MPSVLGSRVAAGLAFLVALSLAAGAAANINLEWRPLAQTVDVGAAVGIGLYAVSDNSNNQYFNSLQVIMTWEPSYLRLTGVDQHGSIGLSTSAFTANDSFGFNETNPPADGDGIWFGFAPIGQSLPATPAGSLLTTIMFQALAQTPGTPVNMLRHAQKPGRPPAETMVMSGTYNVVGTLSGPSLVTIGEPAPTGACCLADGSCQVLTSTACGIAGGSYQGDGTTCSPNLCGCRGDMNCDGRIDFADIDPFVAILSGTTPCSFYNADVNGDGAIDFGDIDPFVALLSARAGVMESTAVLLDARPEYLSTEHAVASLLLAPLGAGTVFAELRARVSAAETHGLAILPGCEVSGAYRLAIHALCPEAKLVAPAGLTDFLGSQEPSDWLLFVDARRFPASDGELRLLFCDAANGVLAKHLLHVRRNGDGLHERVLCDESRHVQAIERLYDGVTHVEAAGVAASLISVAAARYLRTSDLLSLAQVRTRLSACAVPSHDVTDPSAGLDLTRCEDLLALNARCTLITARGPIRPPFTEIAAGIWVGPGSRIDPTSRIYGPAILHAAASVGPRAVVVGPTVLGAGAHVEQQGLVSQSLLMPGARVRANRAVVHCVLPADSGLPAASRGAVPAGGWRAPFAAPPAWEQNEVATTASQHSASQPGLRAAVKRAFDFSVALSGLLVLLPLFVLVAALVRLTSRGPACFSQEREGRAGKVFRCWKFRTMVDRAHVQQRALYQQNMVDGPQFKLPDDPRLTGLGRWLRTTNIDELPQLYNVLRGEMSLIGPRPSPFRENQICVPWRNARLSVRPGITGLWQICRQERSAGDFHQWIHFDLLYVRHWSLGLDLRIFAATLLTLGGRWNVPVAWMVPARQRQGEPPALDFVGDAWPILRRPDAPADRPREPVLLDVR